MPRLPGLSYFALQITSYHSRVEVTGMTGGEGARRLCPESIAWNPRAPDGDGVYCDCTQS